MPIKPPTKEKPSTPETPEILEKDKIKAAAEKAPRPETSLEKEPNLIEKELAVEKAAPPTSRIPFMHKKPAAQPVILEKSKTFKEIESILSEGLGEIYQSLPDNLKEQFKVKGEETTTQIERIISQTKIAVHKIVDLIKTWLMIIPGVNKFFLEQESKLKAGKILSLAEKKKVEK